MRARLLALSLPLVPSVASAEDAAPHVVARIHVGRGPCAGVAGFGSFWETNYGSATLSRVNPRTNKVTRTGRLGAQPCGIAVGAGSSVWETNNFDGTVARIDPATNRIVKTITTGGQPTNIGIGSDTVWIGANGAAGQDVFRIDPASNTAVTVPTGHVRPSGIVVTDDAVWIANGDDTVTRLDSKTNSVVAAVNVGHQPQQGRRHATARSGFRINRRTRSRSSIRPPMRSSAR